MPVLKGSKRGSYKKKGLLNKSETPHVVSTTPPDNVATKDVDPTLQARLEEERKNIIPDHLEDLQNASDKPEREKRSYKKMYNDLLAKTQKPDGEGQVERVGDISQLAVGIVSILSNRMPNPLPLNDEEKEMIKISSQSVFKKYYSKMNWAEEIALGGSLFAVLYPRLQKDVPLKKPDVIPFVPGSTS